MTNTTEHSVGRLPERRRPMPGGWLHVDRPLPFLFVNRSDASRVELGARLVAPQPAHLVASDDPHHHHDLSQAVDELIESAVDQFGAFLLVEVWVAAPGAWPPIFEVHAPIRLGGAPSVDQLVERLEASWVFGEPTEVRLHDDSSPAPPGLEPLIGEARARTSGTLTIGLEVPALVQDPESGDPFPLVVRDLERELSHTLRGVAAEFCAVQTRLHPRDPRRLGRRSLLPAERAVDRELVAIATSFDELLLSTPVDVDEAWAEFDVDAQDEPRFRYPPLPVDPDLLKRRLWDVRIEDVEDPTVADLFRSKRHELDRILTMLTVREDPAFLRESITLYGGVEAELAQLASSILDALGDRDDPAPHVAGAEELAAASRRELDRLAAQHPDLDNRVEVRPDVAGVITSAGNVLIGDTIQLDARRIDALVQHEVGVHVVTHVNGSQQRLGLLGAGLAGYVSTQEGIGVLAEHAVGGLTTERLRVLAARVVAVEALLAGASFVETFRELGRRCRLHGARAFRVAMRVHRGGGLTKDAGYLRGFDHVLRHLGSGGELDTLLLGKLSLADAPLVEELWRREVLTAGPLRPAWLDLPEARQRIGRIRAGASASDFVGEVLA